MAEIRLKWKKEESRYGSTIYVSSDRRFVIYHDGCRQWSVRYKVKDGSYTTVGAKGTLKEAKESIGRIIDDIDSGLSPEEVYTRNYMY